MNPIHYKYKWYVLPLMLLSSVITSCSNDDFAVVETEKRKGNATLEIRVALAGSTRSDDSAKEGHFEVGEGLENYLAIPENNYRIYFFDTDNKYITTFKTLVKPSVSDSENVNGVPTWSYYNFRGEIPNNTPMKFKLVTLFNWPEYPEEGSKDDASVESFRLIPEKTSIEDLCTHADSKFEALTASEDGTWLDEKHLIPFYGVREYDLEKFTSDIETDKEGKKTVKGGTYVDLGSSPLPLLRAMAKVEVIMTNPSLSLESVEIDKYNKNGFCAPESATSHDGDDGYDHDYDWDKDFIQDVHLPGDQNDPAESRLPLTKVSDAVNSEEGATSREKWIAYVPEYRNRLVGESDSKLLLTLKKPDNVSDFVWNAAEKTKTIYFAEKGLSENNRFDVWRNNIYRFTINATFSSISCIVDVQPYAEVNLNPDFGLTRDEDGNIIVRDENGKIIKVIPIDGSNAQVTDVLVGDMSYVEVKFNDVIKFREFTGSDGKPDGRRQDFLATGWNIYDKDGNLEACYIYTDNSNGEKSSYSQFRYGNLTARWIGCSENTDQTGCVGGIQDVKTNRDDEHNDQYNISYRTDLNSDKWEINQTILEVYDVDDNGDAIRSKLLTIIVEDGEVNLDKKRVKIESDDIEKQYAVEVYEGTTLKYRFFVDGTYQLLYKNDDGTYDWDFYTEDGWRFSGFDHLHPGYDNKSVFSRYDRWGNIVERSVDATVNEKDIINPKHGILIIDSQPTPGVDGSITIRHRQKDSSGNWLLAKEPDGKDSDSNWLPVYEVSKNGDKKIIENNT